MCTLLALLMLQTASCFLDTAPFYFNKRLDVGHKYMIESSDLLEFLRPWTNDVCQNDGQIVIYKVSGLKKSFDEGSGTFIKHVHYKDEFEVNAMESGCSEGKVVYVLGGEMPELKENIVVVEVDDGKDHTVAEFLQKENNPDLIIVQGKPAFKIQGQNVEQNLEQKEWVSGDQLHGQVGFKKDKREVKRREDSSDARNQELDKIASKVENEFKQAESLLAEEGDSLVSILHSDKESTQTALLSGLKNSGGTGLFVKYLFVSSGLWMCIIVSAFLILILMAALSWMTSIEITYKAFDKQIDFDKKNE